MVPTPTGGSGAIAVASVFMLSLAAAGCAAGSPSGTAVNAPAPEAPVAAVPVAQAETAGPPAAAADSAAEPAIVGAIFTEVQADRGKTAFDEVCSECHTNSEFRGRSFQSNWGHRTVYSFYRTLRSTMPDDNPGGLEPQVYLDVVSYILSMNGHETGESELSPDSPMREVRIDPDSGS